MIKLFGVNKLLTKKQKIRFVGKGVIHVHADIVRNEIIGQISNFINTYNAGLDFRYSDGD